MNLLNFNNILKLIIFLEIIISIYIWFYWIYKNKNKINYWVSPILFLFHALLFSILAVLNLIPKDIYTIWRDLVFIHALTIFMTAGIIAIKLIGGKK